MSEFLWCPECRQSFIEEPRLFFAQRCTDCGGLLEGEEAGRCEIDYKELDVGDEPREQENEEHEEHEEHEERDDAEKELEEQEISDDNETESEAE